jgi:hypothetical protein
MRRSQGDLEQPMLHVPEQVGFSAETPRDLLAAVVPAPRPLPSIRPMARIERDDASPGMPVEARTLDGVLAWHAEKHPDRIHLELYEATGPSRSRTLTCSGARRLWRLRCARRTWSTARPSP